MALLLLGGIAVTEAAPASAVTEATPRISTLLISGGQLSCQTQQSVRIRSRVLGARTHVANNAAGRHQWNYTTQSPNATYVTTNTRLGATNSTFVHGSGSLWGAQFCQ